MVTSIHFPLPEAGEKVRRKDMSVTFVKRVPPTMGRGMTATEPKVSISAKGQMVFNKLASAALQGYKLALVGFDQTKKGTTCMIQARIKDPSAVKFPVKLKGLEGSWDLIDFVPLATSKKGGTIGCSLKSTLARDTKYDYANSGLHSFTATVEDNTVSFEVPHGALTPRPSVPRKPRAKKGTQAATAQAAPPPNGANGAPATEANELEL